jgi:fluoride exporter
MHFLLLVGIGGFVGAILRYAVSGLIQGGEAAFPFGTLGVNAIGSFVLGFIMYSAEYGGFFPDEARAFLTIGMLGAFTTMSTFGYESFKLLENDEFALLGINILGTVFLALCAVYLGKVVALNLWR